MMRVGGVGRGCGGGELRRVGMWLMMMVGELMMMMIGAVVVVVMIEKIVQNCCVELYYWRYFVRE